MKLDVSTLMAMESFVTACVGAALVLAWSQHRAATALGLWGGAIVLAGAGLLGLTLADALDLPALAAVGGNLMALSHGLTWKAARTFDRRPAPVLIALLGVAMLAVIGGVPQLRHLVLPLGIATGATYLLAAASSLWLRRKDEPLQARRPIVIFAVVHAFVLLIGAGSSLIASSETTLTPSVFSAFGLVHFESIIFYFGSAFFILYLVKERSEAASLAASRTDSLTGIRNRAAFTQDAERVLGRCRRDREAVALLMFDLDKFKMINDTHGHAVGDSVIRAFAEVLTEMLRPTDICGRLGGEEFAAVLPQMDVELAWVRAEEIRVAFGQRARFIQNGAIKATVSGGLAYSAHAEDSLAAMLESADKALYQAKAGGRNQLRRADRPEPGVLSPAVIRVA